MNPTEESAILYTSAFVKQANENYLEPLAHTLVAGIESLQEQVKTTPVATHDAIYAKKNQIE